MADDVVRKIKDALNIEEIIGESMRLTRKGRSFKGLCPFHDEKTPSFTVSPERQAWHCFGCGRGGDVFSFVMLKENMSFPEALEYLAKRAGVELPRRRRRGEAPDLNSVMESAVSFFRTSLRAASGAAGMGYLSRRNITASDADRFELGWAPSSWHSLESAMKELGITQQQLISCGLVVQGENSCYDRFRGRVIFPIRNVSGRPIAFGGRIVDGDGAKYLNSPEGPLYNKRENLYLLNVAKSAIREKKRSILVEGYMDAVRLHMHGWSETVASLGTALTEQQASLLKRFADRCYICYDSDAAGQAATLRGMYVLQRAGLEVFVVTYPGGKDPDEMLQTEGGDAAFEESLNAARPLVLHHLGLYREQAKRDGAPRAGEELLESLSQLTAVELAPYMRRIAQELGLIDYQLASELNRLRRGQHLSARSKIFVDERPTQASDDGERITPPDPAEAGLVYLLWTSDQLRGSVPITETVRLLENEHLKDLTGALLSGERPETLESRWLELNDSFPLSAIAIGGDFCDTLTGETEEKWNCITEALARRQMKKRYEHLRELMLRGQATSDDFNEYMKLSTQLK